MQLTRTCCIENKPEAWEVYRECPKCGKLILNYIKIRIMREKGEFEDVKSI